MKYVYIIFAGLLACSCSNRTKIVEAQKRDSLEAVNNLKIADKTGVNVLDSLQKETDMGLLANLHYRGNIDYPTGHQSECNIMIYRYQNCSDGVYVMTIKDLKTKKKQTSKGRIISMKDDQINIDATIYQTHPFKKGDIMEFLFTQNFLQYIANTPQNPRETSQNVLTLQNRPSWIKIHPKHIESIWH